MDFAKFNTIYSPERLSKYKRAANRDNELTEILYYYNQRLAKSFQPLVSNVEVMLRNKLNKAIATKYSDDKWLLHRVKGYSPTGIAPFTGVSPIDNNYLRDCLRKADQKLVRKGRSITQDRLISELDFGFWTSLYNNGLPTDVSAAVMSIFCPLPPGTNRQTIKGDVNKIRLFRNRICHNNTLFFTRATIDIEKAVDAYKCMVSLSKYLDSDVFIEFQKSGLDTIPSVIRRLSFDLRHPVLGKMRFRFLKIFNSISILF